MKTFPEYIQKVADLIYFDLPEGIADYTGTSLADIEAIIKDKQQVQTTVLQYFVMGIDEMEAKRNLQDEVNYQINCREGTLNYQPTQIKQQRK